MKKIILTLTAASTSVFMMVTAASAAPTWTGTTSDWNTAGNWSGGIPTSTSVTDFTGGGSSTVNISGTTTPANAITKSITFTGGTAYTISSTNSGILSLVTGGSLINTSTVAQTLDAPIVIGIAAGAATYTFGSSTGTAPLILNGGITGFGGTGSTTLDLVGSSASGTNQLNGVISDGGSSDLTSVIVGSVTGEIWALNGANTYTGGTTLTLGTLEIGNNSALGTGALTYAGGTISAVGAPVSISNNITASTGGAVVFGGTSNLTVTGTTTLEGGTDGITDNNVGVLTLGAVNLSPTTGSPTAATTTLTLGSGASLILNGVVANGNGGAAAVSISFGGLNDTLALNGTNTFGGTGKTTSFQSANASNDGTVVIFGSNAALGNSVSFSSGQGVSSYATYFEAAPGGVTISTPLTSGGISFNGANNLTLTGAQTGFSSGDTAYILGTGTLIYGGTLSATSGGHIYYQGNGNLDFNANSQIDFAISSFDGPGTVTLSGTVGSIWIESDFLGGTATLDYSTNANVVADAGKIGGVTIELQSGSGGNQVFTGTMEVGQTTIENISGSSTSEILQLGALGIKAGEGLDFVVDSSLTTPTTVATTTRTNTNGIMGGDAVVTNSTGAYWAVSGQSATVLISAYTSGTTLNGTSDVATGNYNLSNGTTSIAAAGETINSLNFTPAASGNALTLSGNLTIGTGGLLFNGSNNGTISGPGVLKSGSGKDLYIEQYGTGTLTISSVIADNSTTDLTKNGPGTLVLSGNNTYAGQTYINQGTISIASDTNLNAVVTGTVTLSSVSGTAVVLSATAPTSLVVGSSFMGSTVTAVSGTSVTLASAYAGTATTGNVVSYSTDTALNLDGGTLEYSSATSGSLSQAAATDSFVSSTPAAARVINLYSDGGTFQVDNAGTTLTVAGVIQNGAAVNANTIGSLTKTGAGTLLLTGANTYSGGTTIEAGVLQLGNAKALGGTFSYNTLNISGGTLDLNGFTPVTGPVTLTSGSIINTGGAAAMNAYSYNLENGTVSAVLGNDGANPAPVTKSSDGSLSGGLVTLSAANTYTGVTNVNAGILAVTNTTGSGTGSGVLNVNAGGIFAGTGTVSSSNFNVIGSSPTATANILVGQVSATDTNTTGKLTMSGSGLSTITDAKLTFNLNASAAGNGNELMVGSTAINFGSGVTLSLNMQDGVAQPDSAYILIAGTGSSFGGVDGSQYTGFTTTLINGQEVISGLNLDFGNSDGFYAANSYLFLNQIGGVDDIEVEVIPEPSTWAMMAGGLALLVVCLRRKNQRL